jgi:hypothetical protein
MGSLAFSMFMISRIIGPQPCHARVFVGDNAQLCLCAEDLVNGRIAPRRKYHESLLWLYAVCTNKTPVVHLWRDGVK